MTEHNVNLQETPPLLRLPDPDNHSPSSSRDSRDMHERRASRIYGSPETGESSRSGSLMNSSWIVDATVAQRRSQDEPSMHGEADEHRPDHDHSSRESKRSSRHHKPHKHKSAGAFLLSDPFGEASNLDTRTRTHRLRRTPDKGKQTSKRKGHEASQNGRPSEVGLGLPPDLKPIGNGNARRSPGTPPQTAATQQKQEESLHSEATLSSPQSSHSSVDMDSTQIVSMALNLSESRRLAQRRISSQIVPPRLAPLPTDSSVAGTLRQQLQQQRRVSRTGSPRADRGSGQRAASSGRITSSLQPPFEPISSEGSYRYNFSNSTMARAQKAKDYMELLSQYRRVLELLPPLKPNSLSKVSTATEGSQLSMPMSLDSIHATGQIGRPYDPLQYIRNRKVRARERQAIDGQSQGFGDVNRVTDWVDDVAKWVATRQLRTPGSSALPPFSGADVYSMDSSPPTHITRPAMVKPKRPKNDWIIEPADMLADIYWLEQEDHKRLVEDRNWRRMFPQDSELYRPLSRAADEPSPGVVSGNSRHQQAADIELLSARSTGDSKSQKADHDTNPSSTREKARQKLHEIRGFHRHSDSHARKPSRNRLRVRRDSTSSSSSSDSEKGHGRRTSGDNDKDILEKQMMEMVAREAQETTTGEPGSSVEPELKQLKTRPSDIVSGASTNGRANGRKEARSDTSDADDKATADRQRMVSPQRPSRESLEVPPFRGRRMSIGSESSVPNSPDFRASRRDNYFIPGIGADLSPSSSRPGSPSRNPLSIVKHIFRDRSRDRATERHQDMSLSAKESLTDVVSKDTSRLPSTTDLVSEKGPSHSRANSIGPEPNKLVVRTTGDSHKSHRKSNSLRLVDHGAGFRSLFKAPRIDSVLKSGVSKVSELLWKKESDAEDSDSSTTLSDESDDDGRSKGHASNTLSPTSSIRGRPAGQKKQERHYLDVMPPFVAASDSRGKGHSRSGSVDAPLSNPTSQRSTRFELLKPPRIDISAVTDSSTEGGAFNASDSEQRLDSIQERASAEDRRPSLSIRPPIDRRPSAESGKSRHFSITQKDLAPEQTAISKRDVARLRAMILSSGVMAMEISRRSQQPTMLTAETANDNNEVLTALGNRVSWPEVTSLVPEEQRAELLAQPVSQAELFSVTARVLGTAIHSSRQRWQSEAESFKNHTQNELLNGRIESLRARLQLDLSAMTRTAAEEADEFSGDLIDGQRRKVKAVVDVIDKLLRRRRRRFRWLRRAGWLALEWLLVGFMWYVWFVVMIARIFLGVGKGFVRGVKWLLWL